MTSDLRFAFRMLAHSRGFTVTALVVLALGIGATTTMFSATNAVLLTPLPYPDADRLVAVRETRAQPGFEKTVMSAREYLQWTRDSQVLRDATIVDSPGLALVADPQQPAVRLGAMRCRRTSSRCWACGRSPDARSRARRRSPGAATSS